MELIWIIIVIVILVALIYWWRRKRAINGYWVGTPEFNSGMKIIYSIVGIKDDVFIWALESENGSIAAQAYKISPADVGGDKKTLTMVSGVGEGVFKDPVELHKNDEGNLIIRGSIEGSSEPTVLFEGTPAII